MIFGCLYKQMQFEYLTIVYDWHVGPSRSIRRAYFGTDGWNGRMTIAQM